MKKIPFRRKSSISYPSREILAIIGTILLLTFLIGTEFLLGREQNCGNAFWLICQLEESVFMDKAETVGFLFAIILFIIETPDRRQQDFYEAWKTIDAAKGVETSGARTVALQIINRLGESLTGLDAEGADLDKIELKDSILTGANLQKSFLRNANLENSNLAAANLRGANLKGANLKGAKLMRVNLEAADLSGANLEGASFEGANLSGANFENANVKGADFRNAKLFGVKGLNSSTIQSSSEKSGRARSKFYKLFGLKVDIAKARRWFRGFPQ